MVTHDEKVERELLRRADEARREGDVPPLERLAAPLNRFAAFVVDYFVLAWPFVALTVSPFIRQLKEAMLIDDEFSVQIHGFSIGAVALLTLVFYQAVFHWLAGATPGKYVFGLRVVPMWSQRHRPSFWASFGRATFWIFEFVLLAIPFLAVMSDPNRRPLHDRLTNMVVVSVRRRGAAITPSIYEIALVRSFTWAVVAILLVGGFGLGIYQVKSMRHNYDFTRQMNTGDSVECSAIDDALEDWPAEHGEAPQRLSVAMALFATGEIDKSCLRSEAEGPLALLDPQRSLAYLAKSFIYSDDQELSDKYLDEVCKADSVSDECRLAHVIEGMANEDYEVIEKQFAGLSENNRVYLSLWGLRQYVRMQDFAGAARFLDRIPDHRSLAYFTVPSRAKVYWGLHREQEARATGAAALDMLTGNDKLQFSSWLCFAEISNSCDGKMSQSCKVFSRLSEKTDDAFSDFQPALTQVKVNDCSGAKIDPMILAAIQPEVRQYADIMAKKSLVAMQDFWGAPDTRFELKDEVARQIIKLTSERKYLDPIRSEWLKRTRGLAWEQLGKAIFSHDVIAKNWVAAQEVGDRLIGAFGQDRGFAENYIVSAYRSGEVGKARAVLKVLSVRDGSGSGDRAPASAGSLPATNEFAEVKRLLNQEYGK